MKTYRTSRIAFVRKSGEIQKVHVKPYTEPTFDRKLGRKQKVHQEPYVGPVDRQRGSTHKEQIAPLVGHTKRGTKRGSVRQGKQTQRRGFFGLFSW